MNGKKARQIRKAIYDDKSHRMRSYRRDENGCIFTVGMRKVYQNSKKIYLKTGEVF